MIADSYAQEFNKCGLKEKVAFLPVNVIHLSKPFKGATYVCLEPLLCEGRFVKHSDNVGGVATSANLPQTFSHFTYQVGSITGQKPVPVCSNGARKCITGDDIISGNLLRCISVHYF